MRRAGLDTRTGLWTAALILGGLAMLCAVALSACAGAAPARSAKYPYGAPDLPISLSLCMRANGVPAFPDPRTGPGGGGVGFPGGMVVEGASQLMVMGQQFAGPAVTHAEQSCKEYLPPGGPPPSVSESQRQQALAAAACMRKHGLPTFPDPTFGEGNQQLALGPGLNPNSPAFQQAAEVCGLLRGP